MKVLVQAWVLLLAASTAALLAQAPAGKDLVWAFPVASAVVAGKPPIEELHGPQKLDGSKLSFTQEQLDNLSVAIDWFPEQRAPMPRIVRDGSTNGGFA